MNDTRTPLQKYEDWMKALKFLHKKKWQGIIANQWHFKSPSGTIHDLSAADIKGVGILDKNEKQKLFLVE
jgi:hypothetical protein